VFIALVLVVLAQPAFAQEPRTQSRLLVATTSIHMQSEIRPDSIHGNHAPGYPVAADLQKLVVEGQPAFDVPAGTSPNLPLVTRNEEDAHWKRS
jgi:hypothetical protein